MRESLRGRLRYSYKQREKLKNGKQRLRQIKCDRLRRRVRLKENRTQREDKDRCTIVYSEIEKKKTREREIH